MFEKVKEAHAYIADKIGDFKPSVGLVLGSGLGDFADNVENKIEIPYEEIPHFHKTSVVGHKGRLVMGTISGTKVAVFQGRFHSYEGHSQENVVLPVRTLSFLGAKTVILTNAAGGINPNFQPGDLVCIDDHINLTGKNPLIGTNDNEYGERFPDMSDAYDSGLSELLVQTAKESGFELRRGVYAAMSGPSYETPAEIRMLGKIGADMIGMSTVPECIAANHVGLKVCGISCITNLAAGISKQKLSHDEVKEVANMAMNKFSNLLKNILEKME